MDIFSTDKRSSIMAKVKNKDSKLELKFRKALWRKGLRYRKNVTKYFGKPDLVLKKVNTVIFIDSCFWHFCPLHREFPKNNADFWKRKLENNLKRDENVNKHYIDSGWVILRVWEHDLTGANFSKTLLKVMKIINNPKLNK